MKIKIIYSFLILIGLNINYVYSQISFCSDTLNVKKLIGKDVNILCLPNRYSRANEILFDTITVKSLTKDYSLLPQNLVNQKAKIINISKPIKIKDNKTRFFVLKFQNILLSVECNYIVEPENTCKNCDECNYDIHPYNNYCFKKVDQDISDFHCFACSLDFAGIDTIITLKRWMHGFAYSNPASYVIWKENNIWKMKAFYAIHQYTKASEIKLIDYKINNIFPEITSKKIEFYKNVEPDYKNVPHHKYLEIQTKQSKNTSRYAMVSEHCLMTLFQKDTENEFLKLVNFIIIDSDNWYRSH